MSALSQLPEKIATKSISSNEVVLPVKETLAAIDIFESKGLLILGWEGWTKNNAGQIGHGGAPQGTISLDHLSVKESAQFCRETIREEAARWAINNNGNENELYFCITVQV
jgi:hypothetical protein